MEIGNVELQKKYEEIASFQKERQILRSQNLEAKNNYQSLSILFNHYSY